jgi:hypothetical protein
LQVCSHYSAFSCCSADDADRIANALKAFAARFSNAECSAMVEDVICGFHCSAAQQRYMTLYGLSPVRASYRVCTSYCDALYDACVEGTFDGKGTALTFTSPTQLCEALPVDERVTVVAAPPTAGGGDDRFARNCFAGRETELRTATLVYGSGMGGGITFANHTFTVEALDGFGRAVSSEDAMTRVMVDGPNMFTPNVSYVGGGKYAVSYAPEIGGYYEVDAVLRNSVPDLLPTFVAVTQASLCPLQNARSAKPIGALAPPPVCAEFSENSCCTSQQHYDVVATSQNDFGAMYNDAACRAAFDKVSCGVSCSPEQSLYFEPNSNTTGQPTFSLCSSFCDSWYNTCKDVRLASGPVSAIYPNARQFCQVFF